MVYIIGDNRSGSTLLDYLLSKHPDAYSLGELHNLYDYYYRIGPGIIYDWRCSCGESIKECNFWSEILREISFSTSFKTRLKPKFLGKLALIRPKTQQNALDALIKDQSIVSEGEEITKNCWRIYNKTFDKTKKKILIDSSKDPLEAYFRFKFRQGKIRFLLIERNIMAVAHSNMNRTNEQKQEVKEFLKTKEKSIYKHLISRYMTALKNRFLAEKIQCQSTIPIVKRIDYLDLTTDPEKTIKEICKFLNIEEFEPPLVTNQYDERPHTLGGSPSRYAKRPIQPDMRWQLFYKRKVSARMLGQLLQWASKSDREM